MNYLDSNSIFMFLRATEYKYAKAFIEKGNIRFGLPIEWKSDEIIGRGDNLEGSFAHINCNDYVNKTTICNIRKFAYFERRPLGNSVYYYDYVSMNLRTFCLFAITREILNELQESNNKKIYPGGKIDRNYFTDFFPNPKYEHKTWGDERPVIIMIKDTYKFMMRLICKLKSLGIKDSEILYKKVLYINKNDCFSVANKFPDELFIKDIRFSIQQEYRIVINTSNEKINKILNDSNGIIDLGYMGDIAQIEEYYYDNMYFKIEEGSIYYSLPESIETDFDTIDKPEVFISWLITILSDENPKGDMSIKEIIKDHAIPLLNYINQRFNIVFDKVELTITLVEKGVTYNLKNTILENLNKHVTIFEKRKEIERAQNTKHLIELINSGNLPWYEYGYDLR